MKDVQQTPEFKCECGAVFTSAQEFRQHQQVHPPIDKADDDARPEGEPGQTEEERREWKHVRREDQKERGAAD